MVNAQHSANVSAATMSVLLLAVFTVSVGYGVMLPLLPTLLERILGSGIGGVEVEAVQISRHTGLLTGVYALALFLFAPAWGRLSDRLGRRGVLLVGLLGFGITMLTSSFTENLTAVYTERFLSGMFASAVTPVVAATVGDFTIEETRGRRLAFVSMAGIIGFLLGPILGVLVTRLAADFFITAMPAGLVAIPLAATALLAFLVTPAVALAVPYGRGPDWSRKAKGTPANRNAWLMSKLFILTFIVSAGIGVFEVGIALRGKLELNLTPYQIALMFTECSLVMFLMQAIVFSPWVKPDSTRWIIAPALTVLAAGLFIVPLASDYIFMLIVIGAVAASAGILSPILTYWISVKAESSQGWELGKQTAASSLGVTMGSAASRLLFNITILPGASFILTAGFALLGLLLSLRLPHLLVPQSFGGTFKKKIPVITE